MAVSGAVSRGVSRYATRVVSDGLFGGALDGASELLRGELQGLALDFTEDRYQPSTGFYGAARVKGVRTTGNLTTTSSDFLTITSPSPKLTTGPSGLLRYQAQNLYPYSEDFSNASWTATGVGVVANVVTATAGGTNHRISRNLALSGSYAVTVTAKAGTHSFLQIYDGASTDAYANFNLATGAVGTKGSLATASSISDLGGGIYACSVTFSGAINGNSFIALGTSASDVWGPTFSAAGTETLTLYKAHGRRAPSDDTYLKTLAAARYGLPLQWTSAGVLEGLLVEESRTNLFYPAQELVNAGGGAWSATNSGTSVIGASAPDGTATANTVTSNGSTESGWRFASTIYAINTTYTASAYVKYGTARYAYMRALCFGGGLAQDAVFFDLQNGTMGTIGTGYSSASITPVGNDGWYRIVATFTSPGAISNQLFDLRTGNTDGANTTTNGQTCLFWGAQFETGAFATSYIQNRSTTTTSVTRAADNIKVNASQFPAVTTGGTLFAWASVPTSNTNNELLDLVNAARTDRVQIYISSADPTCRVDDGTLQATLTNAGTTTNNTAFKHAAAFAANDFHQAFNGTLDGTPDTSGTMPTCDDAMWIGGNYIGTTQVNQVIKQVMVLPRRMTNAELQTLTTNGLTSGNLLGQETAGLALDFTNGDVGIYEVDYTYLNYKSSPTLAASSFLTMTSPSPKLTMGPSGTLRYQEHNLQLQSATPSNAGWAKAGASVSGQTITSSSGGGSHFTYYALSASTLVNGAQYIFKARLTRGTSNFVAVTAFGTSTGNHWATAVFDLSDGTVGQTAVGSGGGSIVSTSCTLVSGSTYDLELVVIGNSLASANSGLILSFAAAKTGNTLNTGTGIPEFSAAGTENVVVVDTLIARAPGPGTFLTTTTASRFGLPLQWTSAGVLEGLLCEEARTNLLVRSQEFGTSWSAVQLTNLTNTTTGPDGVSTSGTLLNENATANPHGVNQIVAKAASAIAYAATVYAKAGVVRTRLAIQLDDAVANGVVIAFDLSGGQVSAVTSIGTPFTSTSATITSVGNGWYRCAFMATSNTGTSINMSLYNDNGSGTAAVSNSYTGTVGRGVYVYGAQLEAGSFPTSYIQTFASTVTRAADNISLSTGAFPFSAVVGTIYGQATAYNATSVSSSSVSPCVVSIGDGTGNEYYLLQRAAASDDAQFLVGDGAAAQFNTAQTSNWNNAATGKLAGAYAANDLASSFNGGAAITDATATLPTVTTMQVGSFRGVSGFWGGIIKQIAYYPVRKTNAELQTLTT